MSVDLSDLVVRYAEAKVESVRLEERVTDKKELVRKALEALKRQVTSVLDGDLGEKGYEVAFLVDLALKAEQADREFEVAYGSLIASRRMADTLSEFVEGSA